MNSFIWARNLLFLYSALLYVLERGVHRVVQRRGDCQGVHNYFLPEDHAQYKTESHNQTGGPHVNNRGPFLSKKVLQMRGCNRCRGPDKGCRGSLLCLIFILSFGQIDGLR